MPPVPPKKRAPQHPIHGRTYSTRGAPKPPPKVHSRKGSRIAVGIHQIEDELKTSSNSFHSSARSSFQSPKRPRALARDRAGGHGNVNIDPQSSPQLAMLSLSSPHNRSQTANVSATMLRTPGKEFHQRASTGLQVGIGADIKSLVTSPVRVRRFGRLTGVIRATQDLNTLGSRSYTIKMWGSVGFSNALHRAQESKASIKKFTAMLEEWSSIVANVGKKVESTFRAAPAKVPQERSMQRLWSSIRGLARQKTDEYYPPEETGSLGLSTKLAALAQGLRVSKGMVKRSMQRYQDVRTKLIKELEDAKSRTDAANAELKIAESKYNSTVQEQSKTEASENASQVTLDKVWQKVDQAKKIKIKKEHHLMFCRNELTAIQRKHDFVCARMQSLFEMKERECQCKLKHTLKFLATQIDMVMHGLQRSTNTMLTSTKDLNFTGDLQEFLRNSRTATSGTPTNGNLDLSAVNYDSKKEVLSSVLGLKGFNEAIAHAHRNINVIKTLELALETAAEAQESEIKLMKKWISSYAQRSTTGAIFTVHDGYSLVPAFNALARAVEEMLRYWISMQEQYQRFERGLHSLRTELKAKVKFQQKQHDQEIRAFEQAKNEFEKAEKELKKARSEQDAAVDKHHAAQKAADRGEQVRSKIFGWGGDDVNKLKNKMDQKIKEYNKAVDTLKRKKEGLQRATKLLEERTKKQLDEMQKSEKKRYDTIQALANTFGEERVKRLNGVQSVLQEAYKNAELCDIHDNVQRFIAKNETRASPPDYVRADYQSSFGYYFHAEPTTPADVRGIMWL